MDLITDFLSATDKIGLKTGIFTGITTGIDHGRTSSYWDNVAADATGPNLVHNQTSRGRCCRRDGNGAGAAVQFATLGTTTHPSLAYTDFLLKV